MFRPKWVDDKTLWAWVVQTLLWRWIAVTFLPKWVDNVSTGEGKGKNSQGGKLHFKMGHERATSVNHCAGQRRGEKPLVNPHNVTQK